MILCVCGPRDFEDEGVVGLALNYWVEKLGVTDIIHGGQTGVDTLAEEWALQHLGADHCDTYPANWNLLGRGAGPVRNDEMAGVADLCLAFIASPKTRGTADCVKAFLHRTNPQKPVILEPI